MQSPNAEASSSSKPETDLLPENGVADEGGDAARRKKSSKRRKVGHACLYCRRSHMTCDEGRPCQRCIKREIGHLCHDEPKGPPQRPPDAKSPQQPPILEILHSFPAPQMDNNPFGGAPNPPLQHSSWAPYLQHQYAIPPGSPGEHLGNEITALSTFIENFGDGQEWFKSPVQQIPEQMQQVVPLAPPPPQQQPPPPQPTNQNMGLQLQHAQHQHQHQQHQQPNNPPTAAPPVDGSQNTAPIIPTSKQEAFLLTAADQASGTRDERLSRVIRSKYEAGLLKPYNYVKGYARLSQWMELNVTPESKRLILEPLSVLRPKFRAIAQSLTDMDLVLIEEAFERLLLDYDRVFSAMSIPACLWRRTGEIYKGNNEFAELIGVERRMLREGRLCIYELMDEEAAVNYWEKYGHVAFDTGQKAVLTTCVLRYKPKIASHPSQSSVPSGAASPAPVGSAFRPEYNGRMQEDFVRCCFSFTIRRDAWGIPTMIVGNFIKL